MAKPTEKQKRFVDFFIETGNATDAARRAGYKQPHVQGAQNLEKLRDLIAERNAVLETKRIADMDEINELWTNIMRDAGEKTQDRLKASELRARVQGAFLDRVEISKTTDEKVAELEAYIAARRIQNAEQD